MERKINTKLLHVYMVLAFILIIVMILGLDIPDFLATKTWDDFRILYLSTTPLVKIIACIIASVAGVAFFIVTIKYNPVRKLGTAPYLSSLIVLSTIYFGAARFAEIFYMLAESDLRGLVYVTGKWYIPLDVVGSILLAIVAFNIFILPGMDDAKEKRNSTFLVVLCWAAAAVSILVLVVSHYLGASIFILNVSMVVAGALMYLVVLITVLITSVKIFKLWSKTEDRVSRGALLSLGFILILGVINIFLLLAGELGLGGSYDMGYIIRCVKNLLYLVTAVLFIPSLIRPSRKLITKK